MSHQKYSPFFGVLWSTFRSTRRKLADGNENCNSRCSGSVGTCIPAALAAVNTADKAVFVTEKAIQGTGIEIKANPDIINSVSVDYRPFVDIAVVPGNIISTIVYSEDSEGACNDRSAFN